MDNYTIGLYGCTGFTGSLVAKELARVLDASSSMTSWALMGRNKNKLEELKKTLVEINEKCQHVGILIMDSNDEESVVEALKHVQVVLNAAGPFTLYGEVVVKNCVNAGVHYLDLTGEVPWMVAMRKTYAKKARETGTCVVHCVGFDSVPSDVTAYELMEYCRKELGKECRVKGYVDAKFEAGGGSIQSVTSMIEKYGINTEMFSLNDEGTTPMNPTEFSEDQVMPKYDDTIKAHTTNFIMAVVNARIVRRSAGLLNYGTKFEYNEVMVKPGFFSGFATTMENVMSVGVANSSIGRALTKGMLPPAGSGPSEEKRKSFYFKFRGVAFDVDTNEPIATMKISGRDPGYDETAVLAAAFSKAFIQKLHTEGLGETFGFHTPISALGGKVFAALKETDLKIEVPGPFKK